MEKYQQEEVATIVLFSVVYLAVKEYSNTQEGQSLRFILYLILIIPISITLKNTNVKTVSLKRECCDMGQNDTIGKIELNPSIVLSSDNTDCKNDIQLFHQLFDELSVHTDYH